MGGKGVENERISKKFWNFACKQIAKYISCCTQHSRGAPRKTTPGSAGVNQNPQEPNLSQVENPLMSEPPAEATVFWRPQLHNFQAPERLQKIQSNVWSRELGLFDLWATAISSLHVQLNSTGPQRKSQFKPSTTDQLWKKKNLKMKKTKAKKHYIKGNAQAAHSAQSYSLGSGLQAVRWVRLINPLIFNLI